MKKEKKSSAKDENNKKKISAKVKESPEHQGEFEAINDQDKNNMKTKPSLVVPVDHTDRDYPKEENVRQQDSNDEGYLGNRGGYKKAQSHHKRDFDNTGRASKGASSRGQGEQKKKKNRY
jgi:hypothetical protein